MAGGGGGDGGKVGGKRFKVIVEICCNENDVLIMDYGLGFFFEGMQLHFVAEIYACTSPFTF